MTLAVDSETLSKTLWPPRAKAEAPLQVDGQLLRIHAARPHDAVFTCATVSPVDESCYALGTSSGAVYGLSLRDNTLFLLARTGLAVRCLSFCGGVAFQTLAVVLDGNAVVFCDWGTGRVLQRFQVRAHERPITSIVVSSVAPTLTLFVSADKITCWTPVATSMDTSNYQYTCIGGTSPSQVLYTLLPATTTTAHAAQAIDGPYPAPPAQPAPSASTETPRFLAVHLLDAYLLTTESNGVVALWSHERRSRASGSVSALHELVQLQCALRTNDDFRIQCSAATPNLLALGARNAPVVAVVRHAQHPAYALEALLYVRVAEPPSSSRGSAATGPLLSVVQLAFVGNELLAVLLSNNRLVFVAMRTRTVAFDIALPAPERASLHHHHHHPAATSSHKSLTGTAVQGAYQLCLHGSTFALVQGEADAYVYYLPAARDHFRQRGFYRALAAGDTGLPGEAGAMVCDTAEFESVKVAPFLRQPGPKSGAGAGTSSLSKEDVRDVDAQRRRLRAAARQAALNSGREPPRELDERTTRAWLDVNAADEAAQGSGMAGRTAASARRRQLQQTTNALYSDVLSAQALQYNMEKLRAYVQQYGVFPSAFRPVVWRFAMGLPEVHVTAPQYAALARRPPHVCVEELMEGFPVPAGAQRRLLEKVLSNLAWHSPVFAMGHFLPALIFPLCHVYPQDPQRITEAALSLFNNWFRDFFSHYPSRPANLVTFLAHTLQRTDAALYQHLEDIGAGADTWGWALLTSFYTDLLSAAEWLQVMDHAVMLHPMWLFHFHVCLIVALRDPLLACQSAKEAQTHVFQQPHPSQVRVVAVLADACRAYHACKSLAPALRSYYTFRDFGPLFEYPVDFPCDMDVVREKILHLDELAQVRAIEQDAEAQLARDKATEEALHLSQEMALEGRRARMAAKYDASADVWRRRVLLEKTREELEARQRALHVRSADEAVQHAEALQRVEADTVELYRQLGHARLDQGREEYKWDLAARLTDQELTRLQSEAQAHVAHSLQRLAETDEAEARAFTDMFARAAEEQDGRAVAGATSSPAPGAADLSIPELMRHAAAFPPAAHVAAGLSPESPELLAEPLASPPPPPQPLPPAAMPSVDRNVSPPPANLPAIRAAPRFIDPERQSSTHPSSPPTSSAPWSDAEAPAHAWPSQQPAVHTVRDAPRPAMTATATRTTADALPPPTAAAPVHIPRVRTPPAEFLAPYHAPFPASAAPTAGASGPPAKPPSALQQLYERMKRAAAASVTTSSSRGSSTGRTSVSQDRPAAAAAAVPATSARQRLHDNLASPAQSGGAGWQPHTAEAAREPDMYWQQESDSSTVTTTSLASESRPETTHSQHTDSTYSVGQVLEGERQRHVREYTY